MLLKKKGKIFFLVLLLAIAAFLPIFPFLKKNNLRKLINNERTKD